MVVNNIYIDTRNKKIVCSMSNGIILFDIENKINKYRDIKLSRNIRLAKININNNKITYAYLTNDNENAIYLHNEDNNSENQEYYVFLEMPEKILNVEITKTLIIIILSKKILIYNRSNYEQLHVYNTCLNENGILLTNNNDLPKIYTVGMKCGEVSYINLQNEIPNYMPCHDNAISCITTDKNDKFLATASTCGTLIRVFDIESNKMLFEFRRGSTAATIYDLSISDDLKWLACCSNRGTLHIFELEKESKKNQRLKVYDYLTSYKSLANYMDYMNYSNSVWSREQIALPNKFYHNCKFDEKTYTNDQGITSVSTVLHVMSIDGKYFRVHMGNTIVKSDIDYIF